MLLRNAKSSKSMKISTQVFSSMLWREFEFQVWCSIDRYLREKRLWRRRSKQRCWSHPGGAAGDNDAFCCNSDVVDDADGRRPKEQLLRVRPKTWKPGLRSFRNCASYHTGCLLGWVSSRDVISDFQPFCAKWPMKHCVPFFVMSKYLVLYPWFSI